ncbi:hypothetical protein GCM10023175_36690 [Pseudonocardia xishanensis]|uniref:Uncharacterized protein n=1 Tax=Pseudonocardia xishanensis TaxID=630995 RepID=A0ABP8RUP4_9PSEU
MHQLLVETSRELDEGLTAPEPQSRQAWRIRRQVSIVGLPAIRPHTVRTLGRPFSSGNWSSRHFESCSDALLDALLARLMQATRRAGDASGDILASSPSSDDALVRLPEVPPVMAQPRPGPSSKAQRAAGRPVHVRDLRLRDGGEHLLGDPVDDVDGRRRQGRGPLRSSVEAVSIAKGTAACAFPNVVTTQTP